MDETFFANWRYCAEELQQVGQWVDKMPDTYIIEVSSEAAGIVVRDKNGFRFFAASHRFNPLEGRVFSSAREAERVATRFLAGGLAAAVA